MCTITPGIGCQFGAAFRVWFEKEQYLIKITITHEFTIFASLLDGAVSFVGFCIACRCDLPVGPADVVLLGVIDGLAFLSAYE
jgi:hypothetical protein